MAPEGGAADESSNAAAEASSTAPDEEWWGDSPRLKPSIIPVERRGLGRFLRACAGVDETTLSAVPSDRHRYAGLGGIVLGTAVMAGCSFALALTLVSSEFRPMFLLGPVIWGLFVFNLDRWLVASTHGLGPRWALVPRLVVAVLFGFVIAEPIVLWVFNDAIEEHIQDERALESQTERANIIRCNPADEVLFASAMRDESCERHVLNVEVPTLNEQIEQLLERQGSLDIEITALNAELREAMDRLQREVLGNSGIDTSGRAGVGPIAASIEGEITTMEDRRSRLESERAEVATDLGLLQDDARSASQSFERAITDERDRAIAEVEERNSGRPGILLRLDALTELGREHFHIFLARWLLTVFLVAVDSMPVIAKAISNKSAYDRILGTRQRSDERQDNLRIGHVESALKHDLDLLRFELGERRGVRRKEVESWADRKLGRQWYTAPRPTASPRRPYEVSSDGYLYRHAPADGAQDLGDERRWWPDRLDEMPGRDRPDIDLTSEASLHAEVYDEGTRSEVSWVDILMDPDGARRRG
ncbi:MAG: DUF4407 domain-containing protein [Actinomycetota bacterium]